MKVLLAVIGVYLALVPVGCGESETATSSDGQRGAQRAEGEDSNQAGSKKPVIEPGREYQASGPFAAISIGKGDAKPEVDPPDRPPPGKTLVRDLEVGTGLVARRGDQVTVYYVGINYKTGEEQYGYWPPDRPTEIQLNFDPEYRVWEENIEGMKVGGLREMVIPSHLLFDTGTIDYVLKLMRVEPSR